MIENILANIDFLAYERQIAYVIAAHDRHEREAFRRRAIGGARGARGYDDGASHGPRGGNRELPVASGRQRGESAVARDRHRRAGRRSTRPRSRLSHEARYARNPAECGNSGAGGRAGTAIYDA